MTKIWFSIVMTFNTSLFVSLVLLLVLPNAKYVSMKSTSSPKKVSSNNLAEKQFGPKFFKNSNRNNGKNANNTKTISTRITTTTTTTEVVPDILYDYVNKEEEMDNMLLADSSNADSNDKKTTPSPDNDYEVNPEELLATEPPDMDPNAELVDENGQVEAPDEDYDYDNDDSTTVPSIAITTTTIGSKVKTTIRTKQTNKSTEKSKKFGELVKATEKPLLSITGKTKKRYIKKQSDRNLTKSMRRNTCLKSPQDSGFWCQGIVGELKIKYYYEKSSESCECFLYYGCLGNQNKFDSPLECQDYCRNFASHGFKKHKTPPLVSDCVIVP